MDFPKLFSEEIEKLERCGDKKLLEKFKKGQLQQMQDDIAQLQKNTKTLYHIKEFDLPKLGYKVIIRKVILDDSGCVTAKFALSQSGEWIKVGEGERYPSECHLEDYLIVDQEGHTIVLENAPPEEEVQWKT